MLYQLPVFEKYRNDATLDFSDKYVILIISSCSET